ncbi:MAG TPA: ATP phosphoribosyltransferase regulatory subunit, partial [Phycisphaerales bacterium]|nr:ATP phosphoribosyltransferase regulatory subunit [Phycisphaerales bacterium]
ARMAAGERGAIAPYALRPEFTPTLARMFAARGGQFPKPCKWFWQGPCFRAERPQRGRLREFWQWNVDHLGSDDQVAADTEVIATLVDLLRDCGLTSDQVSIRISDRSVTAYILTTFAGIKHSDLDAAFQLLDRSSKLKPEEFEKQASALNFNKHKFAEAASQVDAFFGMGSSAAGHDTPQYFGVLLELRNALAAAGCADWVRSDLNIARGLAYYTGTVFEVIVDGERAVAGGGRYDNLIETFGGPPTPAVGFGMGDVVLSLVLQDKGLMPSDKQIAQDLGLRPDAFVISNGQPESDAAVGPMLAQLRRKGMHARRSYKSTKNVGKLLQDAAASGARFAVIIESPTEITLKDMDANTQDKGPASELLARIKP